MKRNAPDLKYFYHVIKVNNEYKVKRSLFVKQENSVAYFSTKEQAEQSIQRRLSEHPTETEQPLQGIKEEESIDWDLYPDNETGIYDDPTGELERIKASAEMRTKKEEGKEGDILEGNKGAKWYLIPAYFKPFRGFSEIVIAEMGIDVTTKLESENKSLREANERLKEAFSELMRFKNVMETGADTLQYPDNFLKAIDEAKQALNQ